MSQPPQNLPPPNRSPESEDDPRLPPADVWSEITNVVQEFTVVVKQSIEDDTNTVYEALDHTFKWHERHRERLENATNELTRVNRQVEAKREALEKLKANSTVRETQAEIFALEQEALEDARKVKELDGLFGATKAQISRLQSECEQLEQYDPRRSGDFTFGASLLKTKLYHELGFIQIPRRSKSDPPLDKLFLRCDSHPEASRVVCKADNDRDGFDLANQLWDLISP